MIRLLVDFNDIQDGRQVRGLIEDVQGGDPRPGGAVLLLDGEQHAVWGTVKRVESGLVYADMEWSTWSTLTRRHLPKSAWWSGMVGYQEAMQPTKTVFQIEKIAIGTAEDSYEYPLADGESTNEAGSVPKEPVY